MLEYTFVMSSEANMDVGVRVPPPPSSRISSVVFLMLNACGKEENCLIFFVSSCENLYAGAFRQLTKGRMRWSGLWSFIRPFIVGADGFKLTYFHYVEYL